MAGHAIHLGILDRFDDDVIADPVDADLADFLGDRAACAKNDARGQGAADQFSPNPFAPNQFEQRSLLRFELPVSGGTRRAALQADASTPPRLRHRGTLPAQGQTAKRLFRNSLWRVIWWWFRHRSAVDIWSVSSVLLHAVRTEKRRKRHQMAARVEFPNRAPRLSHRRGIEPAR